MNMVYQLKRVALGWSSFITSHENDESYSIGNVSNSYSGFQNIHLQHTYYPISSFKAELLPLSSNLNIHGDAFL